jgi:uncharacterized membrane protein
VLELVDDPGERRPTCGGADPEVENTEATVSTANPAEAANLEHRRAQLHGAFGNDAFGRIAEKAARFFGTPQYIVGQTLAVLLWVVLNSTQLHLGFAWDVYPFIALNLLFSLQAAYAARSSCSPRRARRTAKAAIRADGEVPLPTRRSTSRPTS